MSVYRRYIVQQKYVDGKPTEEFRLGLEVDGKNYHSQEACESGSECVQIEYRWATVAGDYICENNVKYIKQKRQQKCVTEDEWTDIYPYEYKRGDVIERESEDCGFEVDYYKVYPMTDGGGDITIIPSKASYRQNTEIGIMQNPNRFYSFLYYEYGSTSDYGLSTTSAAFTLSMVNDWYISAHYLYSEPEPVTEGVLYYSYRSGSEISVYHAKSTLSKADYNGSNAVIIRDLSNVITSIPSGAFSKASYLNEIDFPVCQYVSTQGFYLVPLKNIELPLCSIVGYRAFYRAEIADKSVTSIDLPNCLTVGSSAFDGVQTKNINIPKCQVISTYGFYGNYDLNSINLPLCSSIGNSAFQRNINLSEVTLGYNSVVSFNYSWTFSDCHSGLRIYVPESLCDAYMSKYGSRSVKLDGVYRYYSDIFHCGGHINRYSVILASNSDGSISVRPSQAFFDEGSYITLMATPNEDRAFSRFLYGSTPEYGSETKSSIFQLSVMHDLYVSAEFKDITPYFKIYPMTDGYGKITVDPSLTSYRKGTKVTLIDTPSVNYVFSWFLYGSTNTYGSFTMNKSFSFTMNNDLYVSAVHSYVKPEYEGVLVVGYGDTSKSYYWNKSTLSYSDFKNIIDESYTWIMDTSGCIKNISEEWNAQKVSWVSFPGLVETYRALSGPYLNHVYLYGSSVVSFELPTTFNGVSNSVKIHVDCNLYNDYMSLYSGKMIRVWNGVDYQTQELLTDHIVCEEITPYKSFSVNVSVDGGGMAIVVPSKQWYSKYDEVAIYPLNASNYAFDRFYYGSTIDYGMVERFYPLRLLMTQDWYVNPSFISSEGNPKGGLLYYSYSSEHNHGKENYYYWELPYLTSKYTVYDVVSVIDYGQTIIKISDSALTGISWYSSIPPKLSFPVCKEIGSEGIGGGIYSLDVKQVEVIHYAGLNGCERLCGLDFPELVAASTGALGGTDRITFMNLPKLKYCNGFGCCGIDYSQTLETFNLPSLLYMDGGFYRRTNLRNVNAPNLKVFRGGLTALTGTSITSLNFPNCCVFNGTNGDEIKSIWEKLTSIKLSDKFFLPSYSQIGYYHNYSDLLSISSANRGLFPEGWSNTRITNGTCEVYGIREHSFANSNIEYINATDLFYIGDGAFTNCVNLSEVILKDCQYVGSEAYSGCIALTSADFRSAYSIGASCFKDCSALTNVNVENAIIVESNAFANCDALTSLNLTNVVWLHDGIRDCVNLKDVYLNSSVKTDFYSNCFDGCNAELLIHVPSSQYDRYVYDYGFNRVKLYNTAVGQFEDRTIAEILTSNGSPSPYSYYILYNYGTTQSYIKPTLNFLNSTMYSGSTAVSIIDWNGLIAYIPTNAFNNCTALEEIVLNGCTSIGSGAFMSNTALTKVSIPMTENLDNEAFMDCTSLSTIILERCSNFGSRVFRNCSHLISVYLMSNSMIQNLNFNTVFGQCAKTLSIYVPYNLYDDYINTYGNQTVNWYLGNSRYVSQILSSY